MDNEKIIAALLVNKTIKGTAEALQMSERAIYERMSDREFMEMYTTAKAMLLAETVAQMQSYYTGAIETIANIMQAENVNPATRLQAAQTILSYLDKFSARLSAEEKHIYEMNDSKAFFADA